VHLSVYLFSHNSSLDGRRQKLISPLNSAGIGEGAKPKKSSKNFPKRLVRSSKSQKNDEDYDKSSLGSHRQKLIGALNSAGIGKDAKPKNTSKFFPTKLVRSGNS
jgi:hypothetical protein